LLLILVYVPVGIELPLTVTAPPETVIFPVPPGLILLVNEIDAPEKITTEPPPVPLSDVIVLLFLIFTTPPEIAITPTVLPSIFSVPPLTRASFGVLPDTKELEMFIIALAPP